ncbi:MAG: STAS/SEC14 domain-containing protein [Bacteroidia bacterium]
MHNDNYSLLRVCRVAKQGSLIVIELNDGAEIEPNDVGEIFKAARSYGVQPNPGLLILAHMPIQVSASAREMAAQLCATGGVKGVAVCTDVTSVRVMVNFFVRINRPRIPVRVFSDQSQAEEWLNALVLGSAN